MLSYSLDAHEIPTCSLSLSGLVELSNGKFLPQPHATHSDGHVCQQKNKYLQQHPNLGGSLKWLSHSSNDHFKFAFLIWNGAQKANCTLHSLTHTNWWQKLSNLLSMNFRQPKREKDKKLCLLYSLTEDDSTNKNNVKCESKSAQTHSEVVSRSCHFHLFHRLLRRCPLLVYLSSPSAPLPFAFLVSSSSFLQFQVDGMQWNLLCFLKFSVTPTKREWTPVRETQNKEILCHRRCHSCLAVAATATATLSLMMIFRIT